jgi:hypothetical protein
LPKKISVGSIDLIQVNTPTLIIEPDFCNDEEVKLADICGKRSISLNFATFL